MICCTYDTRVNIIITVVLYSTFVTKDQIDGDSETWAFLSQLEFIEYQSQWAESQESVPTLSNWYSWEQPVVNAIANFGEASLAIINNILFVPVEPCQSL